MSLDTENRFKADFGTNIITAYSYPAVVYTHENLSFRGSPLGIDSFTGGPVIIVNVQLFEEDDFGTNTSSREYEEEGEFIIQFYTVAGSGSSEAGLFYDRLKARYRPNVFKLQPEVGESGCINTGRISRRPYAVEENAHARNKWIRYDFIIPYRKYYNV